MCTHEISHRGLKRDIIRPSLRAVFHRAQTLCLYLYFTRKQMHTGDQKTPRVPIDFFWRHPTRMHSSGKTLGPSDKTLVPSSSSFCSLCHLPTMPPLPSVPPAAPAAEGKRMAERPRTTESGRAIEILLDDDKLILCPVKSGFYHTG